MRKDFGIVVSGSRTSEWIDQLYLFYHSTGKSSPFQLTTYFTKAYFSCYGIWIFSRIVDDLVNDFLCFFMLSCQFYAFFMTSALFNHFL